MFLVKPETDWVKRVLTILPFIVGALVTGLLSVLYAQFFNWAESFAFFWYDQAHWSLFILTPICFVVAWLLVYTYAPYARGSGIPQVSAAIEISKPTNQHLVEKLISKQIIWIKIASSGLMAMGGGIVGREGPTIQIAASVFKYINDKLPDWFPKISKKNMIISGAAAGLASAFNTPLGGIVFTIEELTKVQFNATKSSLLLAVIIAGLTALGLLGPYLYIGTPTLEHFGMTSFWLVILIGIFTSAVSTSFGLVILNIFKHRKQYFNSSYKQVVWVLICAFIIALSGYIWGKHALCSGKEIMVSLLFTDAKNVHWYEPLLRITGSLFSFTTGAAGGIFAPSLSAGASFGAFFASFFHITSSETNLLILCGMVSFLTGITKSPFTSSILVYEMTSTHQVVFYLLLSGALAYIVSYIISRKSFYEEIKSQILTELEN